jgi:hypothetical protein
MIGPAVSNVRRVQHATSIRAWVVSILSNAVMFNIEMDLVYLPASKYSLQRRFVRIICSCPITASVCMQYQIALSISYFSSTLLTVR